MKKLREVLPLLFRRVLKPNFLSTLPLVCVADPEKVKVKVLRRRLRSLGFTRAEIDRLIATLPGRIPTERGKPWGVTALFVRISSYQLYWPLDDQDGFCSEQYVDDDIPDLYSLNVATRLPLDEEDFEKAYHLPLYCLYPAD